VCWKIRRCLSDKAGDVWDENFRHDYSTNADFGEPMDYQPGLNEDDDQDCLIVSHCTNPLVTNDYSGDDKEIETNQCTADRIRKKNARAAKKKQRAKDLKALQQQAKSNAKSRPKSAKSQSRPLVESPSATDLPKVDDAAEPSRKKSRTKSTKSQSRPLSPSATDLPKVDDAAEPSRTKSRTKSTKSQSCPLSPSATDLPQFVCDDAASQSKQKKLQTQQRQQEKTKERIKKYDTMVDSMAKWFHDVYRKDTGTERGLGIFASRRIQIGMPTAK
jgi:hypothetical protein